MRQDIDTDKEEIQRFGHKLAGSASLYGFPKLGELGRNIENAIRSENRHKEVEYWDLLKREIHLLIPEIYRN